jgi:hypothetical protein
MTGCACGDEAQLVEDTGVLLPLVGELPWYCDLIGEVPLATPELATLLLVGEGFLQVMAVLKGLVLLELELERRRVGVESLPAAGAGGFEG